MSKISAEPHGITRPAECFGHQTDTPGNAASDQETASAPPAAELPCLTDRQQHTPLLWQSFPYLGYAARRHRSWVEEVEDGPQGSPQRALHNALGVGKGVLWGLGVQL